MSVEMSRLQRIRCALRLRTRARTGFHRLWRRLGWLGEEWSSGLPLELQAWEEMLRDGGRNWVQEEYRKRMSPDMELQEDMKNLVPPTRPEEPVRILDVGAGPLSSIGKKWTGRTVELHPIDPLAGDYKALLARLGIRPPVLTEPGHGEKLLEQFARNYFDLAVASNSLDHSYDPLDAIRQMFAVVKPRASVYLGHYVNEGLAMGYAGLHQWNFNIRNGDMILSDGKGRQHSLAREFQDVGDLKCEWQDWYGRPVVIGKLRKLKTS